MIADILYDLNLFVDGRGYAGRVKEIKLPTIKGKQVTAAEVYYTAVQNGKTYDDILKSIGALK